MRAALALARRGLGRTWPNPSVGCMIVAPADPARIVGRGWTGAGGRPHGETIALEQAGGAARGATAYVTLEPCSHHGKTPPCADALIAAGIARVVSAMDDPDPRVAGAGHAALRAAGVSVDVGCLAGEAGLANAGHVARQTLGRPYVTVKLAVSRDGMIAGAPGQRTRITGDEADAYVHMMRALADAVMVGAGTWRADDPQLTCRLPGLGDRSPVRIALDARAELPLSSKLVGSAGEVPLWVAVGPDAPSARRSALEGGGAVLIEAPVGSDGRFDLAALLILIAGRGVTRLMVEGGGHLAESLIAGDLAGEAAIISAPAEIGPSGVPGLHQDTLDLLDDPGRFDLVTRGPLGPDTLTVFRRRH